MNAQNRRLVVAVTTFTLLAAPAAWAAPRIAPSPSRRVVQLRGAQVRFGTRIRKPVEASMRTPDGKSVTLKHAGEIPGLVVRTKREVKDPNPKNLEPQVPAPERVATAHDLITSLKADFGANAAHLAAGDVAADLQPYVSMLRKTALIDAYDRLAPRTGMAAPEAKLLASSLEQLRARVVYDVQHTPAIGQGVASNYHPYSSPFSPGVALLGEVAPNEVVKSAIRHALNYIARRKTTRAGSQIREWDLEKSIGMRVAANTDAQESVSVKPGSENNYIPSYVTISVATSNLPAELAAHSGKAVYRLGNEYYLDGTGTKLPASAAAHLVETPIEYAQMTLRDVKPGEVLRPNFKFDWTGSGGIQPTAVDTSWWGHCHIEAPLAALGIEAKSRVTYFNEASGKQTTFNQDRANDLLFHLFDTERMIDPATGQDRSLDKTTFVGARNDAYEGFGDQLVIRTANGTMPIEARLMEVFKPGDNQTKVDQTFLFQENIPSATGLTRNPEYLRQADQDVHYIKGDRKVVAEIKFAEWDSNGMQRERRQWVTIDPQAPGRALIGGDVQQQGSAQVLTKYYWNLKDKTVETLRWKGEFAADGSFKRTLLNAVETGPAPADEEFAGLGGMPKFDVMARNAEGFDLAREVQMESADKIGQFLEDSIRYNQGAVVETSPDGPVWNFPMRSALVSDVTNAQPHPERPFNDLARPFERVEMEANGKNTVVARTRGANGKVTAAEFESPFLDFAWRPERWHALPVAPNAVNYDALKRGLLWGKDATGAPQFTLDLYGMATDVLYLSMVDASKPELFGIRRTDGTLEYFDTEAEFTARKAELVRPAQ